MSYGERLVHFSVDVGLWWFGCCSPCPPDSPQQKTNLGHLNNVKLDAENVRATSDGHCTLCHIISVNPNIIFRLFSYYIE